MSGFAKKNEYLELRKFNGKLYTLYIYGMSEFVEKLNLQNYKIQREIVYIIYVRNFWICRNIEYPELGKFNEKLCMLYARNV